MTLEDIIAGIFGGQGAMQPQQGQTPNDLIMGALGAPQSTVPAAPAFGMRRADSGSVTQSNLPPVATQQPPQANPPPAPTSSQGNTIPFSQPKVPEPDFMDRLGAFAAGNEKAGLLGGIANAFKGPDEAAQAKRQEQSQVNHTYEAMVSRGIDPASAQAIVLNKDLAKAVLPKIFAPREPGKPTGLMQNYEYAKQSGYGGSFLDFMKEGKAAEGGSKFGLNPQYGVDENGEPALIQLNTDGSAQRTAMPPGIKLSKEPIKLDAGTEWVLLDPITRQPVGRQSKNVGAEAAAKEAGTAQGKAQFDLPRVEAAAKRMTDQIDAVLNDKRLGNVTGWQANLPTLNPKNVDVEERIAQLGGGAFLQAFESLKGGGQITEVEGDKATKALARLKNLRQSDGGFKAALEDFKTEVGALAELARKKAGGATDAPSITSDDDYAALPSGAVFTDPNGQQRRKP